MDGIDASSLCERVHQRHENDNRRDRLDEIADDCEKCNHQKHDQMRIMTGNPGNPIGDDYGAAQICKEPAESIGRADRNQWQRENQAREAKNISKKPEMTPVQRRNYDKKNVDD